jgi:uncharacterized protein (TIGR02594 family)
MEITAFKLAERFVGTKEAPGAVHNPVIVGMLQLDGTGVKDDETAWCSAFANYIAWLLRLPRSKSLAARSWLTVGRPVQTYEAEVGFDVVILRRGTKHGPEVTSGAPGHVGFFAGIEGKSVLVLAGNQGNQVSVARFPLTDLLGIRRLV